MSPIEARMEMQLKAIGQDFEREVRFHPPRRWRFDFAIPDLKIAIECEGGIYSNGRHVRGKGFENDCEKYNQAVLDGWRVLRFTGRMVKSGEALQTIERAVLMS